MSQSLQWTNRDEVALDAAIAEYLELADRGEAPEMASFLAKYGSLAPQLREFLEMSNIVEEIVAAPSPPANQSTAMKDTADSVLTGETIFCRESPAQTYAIAPPTGVPFGRYYLLDSLGEGSMGKVQLAYDTTLDRLVALKMPRFDNGIDSVERFYREARASATLRHPHICPVFDVGTIEGVHFLSMAYIDGQSLAQLMEGSEPLPIARALEIVGKLASALEEAHRHNVIHRDLKPANIMLDAFGEPIVTDFGLARRLDAHDALVTQSCMLVGTLSFMSPEQMEGLSSQINRSTDVYSLGVILYQLLTGMLPFKGSFVSVVVQVRHGKPVPPSLIRPEIADHPGVEAICLKMMAKRAEQRYASMAEVSAAIAALNAPPAPPPTAVAEPLPPQVATQPRERVALAQRLWDLPQRWLIGGASCICVLTLVTLLAAMNGAFDKPVAAGPQDPAQNPVQPVAVREPRKEVAVPMPAPVAAAPNKEALPKEAPAVAPDPAVVPPAIAPAVPEKPPTKVLPAPAPPSIATARVADRKFGVAQVSLEFPPGTGPDYRPDHACHVATTGKAHYPAFTIELDKDADVAVAADDVAFEPAAPPLRGRLAKFTAYFLCADEQPLKVRLFYAGQPLTAELTIPAIVKADRRPLLQEWWAAYTAPAREPLNADARRLKTYLNTMLARRLELPAAAPIPLPTDDASMLEQYFEKSVGTFLGFSSVQAALGSAQSGAAEFREPADQGVPPAPPIASVPVPHIAGQVAIETIASHVPDDCVYLRCQSLDNYLWFRQLLLGWGGSLDEVVSSRTRDDRVRERLEQQLAMVPDAELNRVLVRTSSDMALIFGDPFFDQGAAVGVVFQAEQGAELDRILRARRAAAQRNFASAGASEKSIQLGNHRVSLLSTGNKRLLSYYAVDGDYYLITNSEYLVTRFFEAGDGRRSLAKLPEYRYARTRIRVHDDQSVFLYMSDPFFQRVISPHYQIERARRSRSRQELEELSLAYLASRNEGSKVRSVADLKSLGYLSPEFGTRSDGTTAVLRGPAGAMQAEDSRRGLPGYFLPICDTPVTSTTRSEWKAYQDFVRQYRTDYRMIDPVALVASHRAAADGQQTVDLEIAITPYALGKYAPLRNGLAAATGRRIEGHADDLLKLNAVMRTEQGANFLAYAAVRDTALDFSLEDGHVQIAGKPVATTFANENYYAAFDRRDPDCLWSVVNVTNGLGVTHVDVARARSGLDAATGLLDGLVRLPVLFTNPSAYFGPREVVRGPGWHIMSRRDDLKREKLAQVATSDTKQARLELQGLQGRKIEPYIQAYTFLEARRASARNAALLELASQQLGLRDTEALNALDRVYCARLICPLGGEFTQGANRPDSAPDWHSDKWTASSLYEEHSVPADYRFAFLDWLRGLNVGFALEEQTLKADLQLQVKPPAKAAPAKGAVAKGAK